MGEDDMKFFVEHLDFFSSVVAAIDRNSVLYGFPPSLQFVPFFSLLRKHTEVYDLDDGSGRDYRRGHHRLQLFMSRVDEASEARMDAAFAFLAGTFGGAKKSQWNAVSYL